MSVCCNFFTKLYRNVYDVQNTKTIAVVYLLLRLWPFEHVNSDFLHIHVLMSDL